MMNAETRLLLVLGNPIAHTRSPHMHNRALAALRINAVYLASQVARPDIGAAVAGIRALGLLGANVTIPFKETVIPFLDEISEESRLIGAVNTIVNRDGRLFGTTTDPHGILMALKSAGAAPRGRRITILGTGGSARTALFTALLNGCSDITVAGRKPEKAKSLIREAGRKFRAVLCAVKLASPEFAERMAETDCLINCTPVGQHPEPGATPVDKQLLRRGLTVFDMVYNPLKTRLLKEARERGARPVSGIEMLIQQGMASFRLWTGRTPPYAAFRKGALSA